METQHLPTIIPMWLSGMHIPRPPPSPPPSDLLHATDPPRKTGLEDVMPEPRGFPQFLPRLRKRVRITFGPPVVPVHLTAVLAPWRARALHGPVDGDDDDVPLGRETEEKRRVRVALTEIIQREVEQLGREVSGPLLGAPGKAEIRRA